MTTCPPAPSPKASSRRARRRRRYARVLLSPPLYTTHAPSITVQAKAAKSAAKPASKAVKTTKAPAKSKATTTTKKPLVEIDDNVDDDAMDVDEVDAGEASEPASAPKAKAAANGKKKSASETYTKVRLIASLRSRNRCQSAWVAVATGAHSQASRLIYRQRGDHHSADVDLRFRGKTHGAPRC